MGFLGDLLAFVRFKKKYWILPLLLILGLLLLAAVLTESSAVLPFIYTLF